MTKLTVITMLLLALPVIAKEPKEKSIKLLPSVLLNMVEVSYNCGKLDGMVAVMDAIGGYDTKIAQVTAHKAAMGCERVDNLRGK